MKTKILLSAEGAENYVNAVKAAGGEPVVYTEGLSLDYSALILCGGVDVHPKYYGEEINGSININTKRDEIEFSLADAFIKAGKPVLGICRGAQLLNIYFGGSLYQDIESANLHKSSNGDLFHTVTAEKGSVAEKLYGNVFTVNSAHHQAVKVLGEGLKITAISPETDVIEAFEHISLPIFGYQWHPERMCGSFYSQDRVDGCEVFKEFLDLIAKA